MEVIDFINDLRKMGSQYYNIWLPIIVQFHKEETVIIKLNVPLNIPKTTYHRIIKYGVLVFPKHVKTYSLSKSHSSLIFGKNNNITPSIFADKNEQLNEYDRIENNEVTIIKKPSIQKLKQIRKQSDKSSYPNEVYEEIIEFLNQTTGKDYKPNSVSNRKYITSRLNDGFTIDDFKKVIQVKSVNWLGNSMEQYLRPETLFSSKFESYLNENIISNSPNSNLKNAYDQVSLATEYYNREE